MYDIPFDIILCFMLEYSILIKKYTINQILDYMTTQLQLNRQYIYGKRIGCVFCFLIYNCVLLYIYTCVCDIWPSINLHNFNIIDEQPYNGYTQLTENW